MTGISAAPVVCQSTDALADKVIVDTSSLFDLARTRLVIPGGSSAA